MDDKNFTRKHLSKKIYKHLGFSKNQSLKIIDDFFETIILDILKSKKTKITSFGTFSVLNKKERIGRNPKTKTEAKISARKVVIFKPSSLIKKKINQNEQ